MGKMFDLTAGSGGGGGTGPSPSTTTPLADEGAGAIGTSIKYARADHVHPKTGGEGGDATYISSEPSLVAVGGLDIGFTAPNGISFQDFADQMLHPYQAPAFTAFAISGAKTFEVGETFASNPTFTFSFSNSANIKANSLKIEDTTSSLVLLENGSISSPKSTTRDAITKTSAGSHGFKITATNSKDVTFNRTASLSWQWAVYSGTSASTSLDSAGVIGLANKKLASGGAGTYALAAGGYKYFCIPASFTQPTKFTNADNGFGVAMESPQTLDVTNAHGVTVSYKVYRTTFELGGTLNLKVE